MDNALQSVGFFYLEGHGVAPQLLDGIRDQSRRFFAEPEAVKLPLAMKAGTGRGYVLTFTKSEQVFGSVLRKRDDAQHPPTCPASAAADVRLILDHTGWLNARA